MTVGGEQSARIKALEESLGLARKQVKDLETAKASLEEELKKKDIVFSAICIQETWLKENDECSQIQLEEYLCFLFGFLKPPVLLLSVPPFLS